MDRDMQHLHIYWALTVPAAPRRGSIIKVGHGET